MSKAESCPCSQLLKHGGIKTNWCGGITPLSMTSALEAGVVSFTSQTRYLQDEGFATNQICGWVRPTAGLHAVH
jgi:hypothetical protein